MRLLVLALLTFLAVFTRSTDLTAQIRASERSTLSQTIDGTVITLNYARPRMRGRPKIFGTKAVSWNETWTPGANWATTLETNRPVTLEGHAVPKGKYSVWMVVRESGDWTMVLDPDHHRFHEDRPDSSVTQIRFPIRPTAGPLTDVLTWSVPQVRVNGGTLAMQWAEIQVTMDLRVEASLSPSLPAADAAPYVGRYEYIWKGGPGEKPDTVALVVTYESGSLYASFAPEDKYFGHFVLIRLADGSFLPGLFEKGEIYEVIRDMVFEFKGPKGRPDAFEVRDDSDELMATGRRLP